MSDWLLAPDYVVVDLLNADASPVTHGDLNPEFLQSLGINHVIPDKPFRVAVDKKMSKAGNAYYEYTQNHIPLPNGLQSFVRIEGVVIAMGKIKPSKTSKNPTREGEAIIVIGSQLYDVTAYLTETKSGFYVKVISYIKKSPGTSSSAPKTQKGTRVI